MSRPRGDARSSPEVPGYRLSSPLRRLGYALLPGESFSYLLHLRPREWPIMAGHTALGWALAVGGAGVPWNSSAGALLTTLFAWVILLNGGTLALNSAFDRDEGDVGYLDNPPPVPSRLAPFACVLMIAGMVIVAAMSVRLAIVYFACMVLSVLYSAPPFRLKAVAGADWIINVAGFGALTPLAGWYASGLALTSSGSLVVIGFAVLFASFYPLTQIYQRTEDLARGDRTLVIALGVRKSLVAALWLMLGAFAFFAAAVAAAGRDLLWALALIPACAAWSILLIGWIRGSGSMPDGAHKRGMYGALAAWGLTDVLVVAAMVA